MSTIKQLKNRISAVKTAEKITKTMNMVASARFVQLKKVLKIANHTKESLLEIVKSVIPDTLTDKNTNKKVRYIVVGTDKGLCGGFNTKIYKFSANNIDKTNIQSKNLWILGVKLASFFQKFKHFDQFLVMSLEMQYSELFYFAEHILNQAILDKIDELHLLYSRYNSALNIEPCLIKLNLKKEISKDLSQVNIDDSASLLNLYNKYLVHKIYSSLLSSKTGEQSSRMIAMNNASKNCSDLIEALTLQMNKVRQANITGELIEIISSSQAII